MYQHLVTQSQLFVCQPMKLEVTTLREKATMISPSLLSTHLLAVMAKWNSRPLQEDSYCKPRPTERRSSSSTYQPTLEAPSGSVTNCSPRSSQPSTHTAVIASAHTKHGTRWVTSIRSM